MSSILTISPDGRFLLPDGLKNIFSVGRFWLKKTANTIVLEPVDSLQIEKNFGAMAFDGFDFWEGDSDDVYAEFYAKQSCQK